MRYFALMSSMVFFLAQTQAMEEQRDVSLKPTIESEATMADTRALFVDFQGQYIASGILHPWGIGQGADTRMANITKRKEGGNVHLDQVAYVGGAPVAYVNLGQMPVKGYTAAGHPIIAQAWNMLGFTDEAEEKRKELGIGYIAFGFSKAAENRNAVIKEAINFVLAQAADQKPIPIQNQIATHFVSLVAIEDKVLINDLTEAGFIIQNTQDGLGFPGFDSLEEKRNRVIAVYTLAK